MRQHKMFAINVRYTIDVMFGVSCYRELAAALETVDICGGGRAGLAIDAPGDRRDNNPQRFPQSPCG